MPDARSVTDLGSNNAEHVKVLSALIEVGRLTSGPVVFRTKEEHNYVTAAIEARGTPFNRETGEVSVTRRGIGPATETGAEPATRQVVANLFKDIPDSSVNRTLARNAKLVAEAFSASGGVRHPRLPKLDLEQLQGLSAVRDALQKADLRGSDRNNDSANRRSAHQDTLAHLNDLLRGSGIVVKKRGDPHPPAVPMNRQNASKGRLAALRDVLARMREHGDGYVSDPGVSEHIYTSASGLAEAAFGVPDEARSSAEYGNTGLAIPGEQYERPPGGGARVQGADNMPRRVIGPQPQPEAPAERGSEEAEK